MQTKQIRTKTLFHFDSGQHPGCTVLIRNAEIPGVTVTVVQDYDTIYDERQRDVVEFVGMVRVFGQFFGWPGVASAKDLGPDRPVDVRVYAFDPMANKSYVMEVTGAYITNLVTHAFLAAAWKPWRELNQPVRRPGRPVDQTPGTPNKNGDQFCGWPDDLIGNLRDWQAKDQPVDKSVPKKTDATQEKADTPPAYMACYKCGAIKMNVMTLTCAQCGYILPTKDAIAKHNQAAKEQMDKPSCKRLHVTQVAPGMWFEAQDGTIVIRGDERFCEVTKGDGFVILEGRVWSSPSQNYEVTILPNFYNEMGRLFNINPQWGYEDSPEKWPNLLAEWMKTWKYFYSRVREILNLHYANDAQVYGRISQLIDKERVAEYRAKREEAKPVSTLRPFPLYGEEVRERAKHRDQFCADCGVLVTTDGPTLCQDCADKIAQREANRTSTDTAHLGPWTTVRACLDCGVLVTGGPTRCRYCADKITQQEKRIDAATKLCCSPEVQAYIEYLKQKENHNGKI